MIRKTMYEVHTYRRAGRDGPGSFNAEYRQGVSGPFETRNTAERCAIAFAQSGQCSRTEIRTILVEESEPCPHPTTETCEKCTLPRDHSIPEPLTEVPGQVVR